MSRIITAKKDDIVQIVHNSAKTFRSRPPAVNDLATAWGIVFGLAIQDKRTPQLMKKGSFKYELSAHKILFLGTGGIENHDKRFNKIYRTLSKTLTEKTLSPNDLSYTAITNMKVLISTSNSDKYVLNSNFERAVRRVALKSDPRHISYFGGMPYIHGKNGIA